MIDKFMHGFLNRVYGYDDYTQLEINSKLIQKMDEVIENCNSAFEFVDWLKEQGVADEVQTIIDTMLEDGTLKNLINQKTDDNNSYILPIASRSTLGGVKIGNILTINSDGVLSAITNGNSNITLSNTLDNYNGTTLNDKMVNMFDDINNN